MVSLSFDLDVFTLSSTSETKITANQWDPKYMEREGELFCVVELLLKVSKYNSKHVCNRQ